MIQKCYVIVLGSIGLLCASSMIQAGSVCSKERREYAGMDKNAQDKSPRVRRISDITIVPENRIITGTLFDEQGQCVAWRAMRFSEVRIACLRVYHGWMAKSVQASPDDLACLTQMVNDGILNRKTMKMIRRMFVHSFIGACDAGEPRFLEQVRALYPDMTTENMCARIHSGKWTLQAVVDTPRV